MYKSPVKVISIGNISFGGTGKTPLTIKIANNLKKNNFKVVILSRGYKRKDENTTKVVFDGKNFLLNVDESGDEPYLIALKTSCPVVVAKNRIEGVKLIEKKFNPDFILLDDAFQHLKIYRDKDILLITQRELENDFFLFRESFLEIKRADCIVITKIFNNAKLKKHITRLKSYSNSPIFLAYFKIIGFKNLKSKEIYTTEKFKNREAIIFCGIGFPEFFKNQLIKEGILIKEMIKFKDHTKYSLKEYNKFLKKTDSIFITTEKDEIKLNQEIIENLDIYSAILDLKITEFTI